MSFADRLTAAWYTPAMTPLAALLAPLCAPFALVAAIRRAAYEWGLLRVERLPVPVIVVGNITVGGSGKTPLVVALARALRERGHVPGIVSRGYGRRAGAAGEPLEVTAASDPAIAGDEPLLLARAGFPVVVDADRARAGRALLGANPRCSVVICDDGLQHYRLHRDVEIAVVDSRRGFGNGWRLPAGPLREPRSRLDRVDAVVVLEHDASAQPPVRNAFAMRLEPQALRRVDAPGIEAAVSTLAGVRVHAIAGIADPSRFFAQLARLGMYVTAHPRPDHHRFAPSDLRFEDEAPVVMTEKDAVKCASFADERCWYLPVSAVVDPAFVARVVEKLRGPEAA
jgi:tetraacyldisaccharide 4'-kinase